MSPQDIKYIAIRNYRKIYGYSVVINATVDKLFDGIANDVLNFVSAQSNPSSHTSGSGGYQTPLPTDLIFQEEKTTTEFMPPDQQLWMDIAVAAARQDEFDIPEWPSEVANTTLDAFNNRFPAAKP